MYAFIFPGGNLLPTFPFPTLPTRLMHSKLSLSSTGFSVFSSRLAMFAHYVHAKLTNGGYDSKTIDICSSVKNNNKIALRGTGV